MTAFAVVVYLIFILPNMEKEKISLERDRFILQENSECERKSKEFVSRLAGEKYIESTMYNGQCYLVHVGKNVNSLDHYQMRKINGKDTYMKTIDYDCIGSDADECGLRNAFAEIYDEGYLEIFGEGE